MKRTFICKLFKVGFIFCFLIACKQKSVKRETDNQSFVRLTSDSDSTKNMYVVYVFSADKNRKMIRSYYNDGGLQGVAFFNAGKKDGHWLQYFDGKIGFEGDFSEGKKEGVHKFYYPNGRISILENYNKGKKVDTWYYYDSAGNIKHTEAYSPK